MLREYYISFWENFQKYHPFSWRDLFFAARSLKVPFVTSTLPFRLSGKSPGWRLALLVLDLLFALGDYTADPGWGCGWGRSQCSCLHNFNKAPPLRARHPDCGSPTCLWVRPLSNLLLMSARGWEGSGCFWLGWRGSHSSSCIGYEASVVGLAPGIPHSHPHTNLHLPSFFLCDASCPGPRRLLHSSSLKMANKTPSLDALGHYPTQGEINYKSQARFLCLALFWVLGAMT